MKVRNQVILLLSFVIVCIFLLSIFLQTSITKETRELLTEKLKETQERDAPKILELNAAYIENYTYDYSIWDQTVEFITGKKDKKWAEEELNSPLANYKLDYIWVLDSTAKPYYTSTTRDTLSSTALNIPATELKAVLAVTGSKVFFVKHNNYTVEVFAGGITNTADKLRQQPQKGYLLLGRIVDNVYMANLKNLSADVEFSFVSNAGAFAKMNDPKTGHFQFSIPLKDFYNNPIGAFNVTRNYPVLSAYQKYLRNYLVIFLIIIMVIGFLFYFISQRLLLEPLAAFTQALKLNSASKIAPYLDKKNEFGNLSQSMTSFFVQKGWLEQEIITRKKSEEELLKALEEKDAAQSEKIQAEEFLAQQQLMLRFNAKNSATKFEDVLKELLALAAQSINCERVGIWEYNSDISAITADFIYLLSQNKCINGATSTEKDYPVYFTHLKTDAVIIANDAITNAATAEFAEDYLKPEGITSMLDIPIRSGNKVIGVVCCEHVGPKREWTITEQMFVRSLSDIIAINFEKEERRKTEALLQKNHLRFEETQELAKIGSWEFNFITLEVVWSKEMYRIFDLEGTAPEKLFEAYRNKIYPEDLKVFDEAVKNLIDNQKTYSVESRIKCNNGHVKYILAIGEAILSPNQGKVIGLRGTVQDITKQKQAALAKSEFLSCMSHEIRTPINGVVGVANLLLEEKLTDKQQEYVKTLNFSAQHLSTVVSDILDFSKIESGHMTFEKISFNLENNCKYIFDLFANKASEKIIGYNFNPSEVQNYSLYGDYVRLNQVLSNLLSNAIKFTDKGSVDFSYSVKEENKHNVTIVFSIKDTGIGISHKQKAQIFESFTQADETITRQYGGTGLGLTISKKLVELQGGKISVTSTPGLGSEFLVELTFDKHVYQEKEAYTITSAEKNQVKDLTGLRILVAEDNKINAMVLTRFLSGWNIENKVATNGIEVLDILENEQFDMILMDIQMPLMDGIEATKTIRGSQNPLIENIPIIAFTADASVDKHRELLKMGFNHCMTKPFNPDILFSYLRKNHKTPVQA
jgi:CheY-like chemotaxis protein/nitrogen-specific signal transduction histidine kinase/sensor domain CHASE-containing protein